MPESVISQLLGIRIFVFRILRSSRAVKVDALRPAICPRLEKYIPTELQG